MVCLTSTYIFINIYWEKNIVAFFTNKGRAGFQLNFFLQNPEAKHLQNLWLMPFP